jgi:DNA-binding CsgD family transcriptional regulator
MEHNAASYRFTNNSFIFVLMFAAVCSFSAFAQSFASKIDDAVACRTINNQTYFYTDLIEAFNAASGTSIAAPDEIILLADSVLDEPIIIEDGKHIRLINNDGEKTLRRGSGNLEYPVLWIKGNYSSFSLGKDEMNGSIIIDGSYLQSPPIEALAPLAAVNGQYSKFIMYDNVSLQNNYNGSNAGGTDLYQNGVGVFVRTFEGNLENQAEFIMRGGIIQGNFNNTQNLLACGGAVCILGFGLFSMEDGVIMNNTASDGGGGFLAGSRGSFIKTGGIIYGKNAPEGYRNTAIKGRNNPKYYGHAIAVALVDMYPAQYRDDTVGEDDDLSYIASSVGNGVFGDGDNWNNYVKERRQRVMIILLFAVIFSTLIFFIVKKTHRQRKANFPQALSPREKEIINLLLTDMSIKEIAYALNISYSGVIFHVRNIYKKFGIRNRRELIVHFAKTQTNGEVK